MTKTHLESVDMPQDVDGIFYKLTPALMKAFNNSREHPYKMTALKGLLKFMYNKVVSFEKAQDKERTAVLTEAQSLGFDLDERLSTDKLKVELSQAITAKAAEDAKSIAETASTESTETKEA